MPSSSDAGERVTQQVPRQCRLTVELSCGPATPTRTNNRHCTGLTESAARRAARQLQRLVSARPSGRQLPDNGVRNEEDYPRDAHCDDEREGNQCPLDTGAVPPEPPAIAHQEEDEQGEDDRLHHFAQAASDRSTQGATLDGRCRRDGFAVARRAWIAERWVGLLRGSPRAGGWI